jgi:hypothetical protein
MNARLYDPVLGRFLSPDPYVQAPDFSQSLNRYSYCLNNPLMYVDPAGEKWWHWLLGDVLTGGVFSGTLSATVITTGLLTYSALFPFTEQAYDLQKMVSPFAFKPPSFIFGSDQNGTGFDLSIGLPQMPGSPSVRFHYGATYYLGSNGGYKGWESRVGTEWYLAPLIKYSSTYFNAGEFSQHTAIFTIGDWFTNVRYENDWMFGLPGGDNGDRWRSAAVSFTGGPFSLNLNMFTGDPGLDQTYRQKNVETIDGHDTYTGGTADKYRAGILSFGFGPFRIGQNSETIRHIFQNHFAHDFLTGGESKWFRVLNTSPAWYWYFGFGNGNTLW